MRKIVFNSLIVTLAVLSACSVEDELGLGLDIDSEESVEAIMEDVNVITEAGFEANLSSGRREGDEIIRCATVEKDTVNQVITIDFGTGCVGPNGRMRSGKIIVAYSGRKYEPGSFRSVTFDQFVTDSVGIEGTRTVTNVSIEGEDFITFNITLQNGQVTFKDGTIMTRESDHTRVWYRSSLPAEDYATLIGSAGGVNRQAINYSSEITEALVFQRTCGRTSFIPVSGIKELIIGEEISILDFGDGTCDNLVSVTKDGETTIEELEYNPRKVRIRRQRMGG